MEAANVPCDDNHCLRRRHAGRRTGARPAAASDYPARSVHRRAEEGGGGIPVRAQGAAVRSLPADDAQPRGDEPGAQHGRLSALPFRDRKHAERAADPDHGTRVVAGLRMACALSHRGQGRRRKGDRRRHRRRPQAHGHER